MNKFNIGVIFAISIQIATFTWFLSSQNSKIEELYKFYEEESAKDEDFARVWTSLETFRENYKTWKNLGFVD